MYEVGHCFVSHTQEDIMTLYLYIRKWKRVQYYVQLHDKYSLHKERLCIPESTPCDWTHILQ